MRIVRMLFTLIEERIPSKCININRKTKRAARGLMEKKLCKRSTENRLSGRFRMKGLKNWRRMRTKHTALRAEESPYSKEIMMNEL
jgi:hypothetical protein